MDVQFWHRYVLMPCGQPVEHKRSGLFLDSSSVSLGCMSVLAWHHTVPITVSFEIRKHESSFVLYKIVLAMLGSLWFLGPACPFLQKAHWEFHGVTLRVSLGMLASLAMLVP